jgi:2-succinyl-6-hydroxy-2,4-cyclohexadiene-1-carboxylate synthase
MVPNFSSLLVDLPAHGGSVDVAAVSVEHTADAVAATMRSVGIASATVVGYSLGARIALSVAARHRALVYDLIIESGSPGIVGTEERSRRRAADASLAARLSTSQPHEFLRFWYGQPVFRSLRRDQALLARLANSRQIPDRTRMATALRAFSPGQQKPNWNVLPVLPGRVFGR